MTNKNYFNLELVSRDVPDMNRWNMDEPSLDVVNGRSGVCDCGFSWDRKSVGRLFASAGTPGISNGVFAHCGIWAN